MAKTVTPFFSLGAQGTVGQAVTAQKRGRFTVLREKPLPTDPRSLPQVYQRWLYHDYAHLWESQSAAARRAYAATGSRYHLTGFQYWMSVNLLTLPDIVAYFKLDSVSGAITPDSSLNNLDATVFQALPCTGRINGALSFDGTDDRVTTPYKDLLNINYPTSIEAYFTLNPIASPPVWRVIVARNDIFALFYNATSKVLQFGIVLTGVWRFGTAHAFAVPDGLLHHLCGTYDGAFIRLYFDGAESLPAIARVGDIDTGVSPLYIGCLAPGAAHWPDLIDQVIIYSRLLDATTILEHAQRRYPLQ